MHRPALILLALLLFAAPAAAQQGAIEDPTGDAAGEHDLTHVAWSLANGTATVRIDTAAQPGSNASWTIAVYVGSEGAQEPAEWYLIQSGPGGERVLSGHTDEDPNLTTAHANRTLAFTFDRIQPAQAPCDLALAESWIWDDGKQVQDTVPDAGEGLAWANGTLCSMDVEPTEDARGNETGQEATPGPGVLLVLVLAGALAAARRR